MAKPIPKYFPYKFFPLLRAVFDSEWVFSPLLIIFFYFIAVFGAVNVDRKNKKIRKNEFFLVSFDFAQDRLRYSLFVDRSLYTPHLRLGLRYLYQRITFFPEVTRHLWK